MAPKKGTVAKVDNLTLKPSETIIAINHNVEVNLRNAAKGKDRRSMFIWGPPGIGKSSLVKQVAKARGMDVIDIRLTQMEPTDLRGIPIPVKSVTHNGEETLVRWAPPALLPRDPNAKAIIVLDELPNAPPSVQAGAYQLVLDGKLGEYVVPKGCVVMAAGNRETDKGGTFKMPTPLMNRFDHIEMRHDFDDFQEYALNEGFHKDVVGYLTAFKHELFEFDPLSASRGFPTPRSWDMVSDNIEGDPNLPEQVMLANIAGCIGEGIAIKFLEYRKNAAQLPNPRDILEGKIKDLKKEYDVSLMYSLTTALCYELRESHNTWVRTKDKKDKDVLNSRADNFFGFIMKNFQPEMVIMGARTALALFRIPIEPHSMKNWQDFADKYQDLILKA